METLKRHVSPSFIVSVLALAVALGASGAIALPGRGSVDSGDLKRNVVASKHLKANAVKPADIDEDSLYIGVVVSGSGAVLQSTMPGVTTSGFTGDDIQVTFPRNVSNCVPSAMGMFQSTNVVGFRAGTAPANRNKMSINSNGVDKGFNLVLVCG